MEALGNFETLELAKQYPHVKGKLIHRNTMNAWLSGANKYRWLKAIAADESHPLADGASAFLDSTEYNLIQSSETGRAVIALMQGLVIAEGNDSELQAVLDKAIAAANEVYYPYENATAYDFAKAKGVCPVKEVTAINGYLKISITEDVEAHRPQVYAEIQGVRQYITTFNEVSFVGDYLAQVPRGYTLLLVDNYYGVIK